MGGLPQFGTLGTLQPFGATSLLSSLGLTSNAHFSALADQLHGADIEVLDKILPQGLFSVQSTHAPALPPIIVARTTPEKAQALKETSSGQLFVTRNVPLSLADVSSFSGQPVFRDPAVTTTSGEKYAFTVEVIDDNGPLPNAEIYVYGSTTTAQGVTDRNGRATFSLGSESQATIRGLLVQPASGYWNMLLRSPQIATQSINSVRVRPLSSTIPGLANSDVLGWGQKAMGLNRLPAQFRGQNIRIAIIDSGADANHPDLSRIGRGFDYPRNNAATWRNDVIGHGSHCAGIICGATDNNFGIRGFAPDAEVHILRVLPEGRTDDLVKALQYCMENDIDVVNLSLGGVGDPESVAAMQPIVEPFLARAKSMGVACIVAAGNSSGPVLYPALSPNVLAVSAVGMLGEFPGDSYHAALPLSPVQSDGIFFPRFSCFGPEVALAAPGVAIVSSVPGNAFVAWDGTSMAAPHVTGLAALVLAHNPDFQTLYAARNAARVNHLFDTLRQTARPLSLGDPARTGSGLPDAVKAMQSIASAGTVSGAPLQPTLVPDQVAEISRRIAAAIQGVLNQAQH
jgi:subtilisin family serine protease